jgi:hypothetical protein
VVKALAVDLGGSHAACAVVADREVLAVETVSLESAHGLAGALPAIAGALARVASRAGVPRSDCAGLAFGFCGLVDSDGRVLSTNASTTTRPASTCRPGAASRSACASESRTTRGSPSSASATPERPGVRTTW